MLTLKLYPSEFQGLILYLRQSLTGQAQVPLQQQLVGKLTLLNYLSKWTSARIYAWSHRKPTKQFTLRLPAVIGLALYQDMWTASLSPHQQMVFDKLDQAIVNYRNPYTGPHTIGELLLGQ